VLWLPVPPLAVRQQAAGESPALLGIASQLTVLARGRSLGVPSASLRLAGALCPLHGVQVAENKPTSGPDRLRGPFY